MEEQSAKRIVLMFSSLSLGKTSLLTNSLEESELGLSTRDLHWDSRQNSQGEAARRKWHLCLLQGQTRLFSEVDCATDVVPTNLEVGLELYTPRNWLQATVKNIKYILRHLSRHLFETGLFWSFGQ